MNGLGESRQQTSSGIWANVKTHKVVLLIVFKGNVMDSGERCMAAIAGILIALVLGILIGASYNKNHYQKLMVEHNFAHWEVKSDGTTVFTVDEVEPKKLK